MTHHNNKSLRSYTMPNPIKIAIVGGGPAGVSLCLQLLQTNLKKKISISLYEKSETLGHGLPYSAQEEAFCLNVPKEYMTLLPGKFHHFSDWLLNQYQIKDRTFPPRHYFGQYCEAVASSLKNDINVYLEHDVIDLSLSDNTYQITALNKNKSHIHSVDFVVLAVGHLPNTLFPALQRSALSPWNQKDYDTILPNDSVAVIGTRLTAIDVVLKLKQQNHRGRISMMSRSGVLSSVKQSSSMQEMVYLTTQNIKPLLQSSDRNILLDSLLNLLEKEIKLYSPFDANLIQIAQRYTEIPPLERLRIEIHQSRLQKPSWHAALSCFYQILYSVWPQIPLDQQVGFLNHASDFLFTLLCSFPLEKAIILRSLMQMQQLTLHSGLVHVEKNHQGYEAYFDLGKKAHYQHLFIATGVGTEIEAMPLLARMLQKKLIEQHPLGGICIHSNTHQVLTANNKDVKNLYVIGDAVRGPCLKTIELGQIVKQAQRVAEHLIAILM